jgi:hypothetical protein
MTNEQTQFAVCIAAGPDHDLERWKLYRVLPDASAAEVECLRVIDESGEDYIYPASRFIVLDLADNARRQLLAASKTAP